MDAEENSVASHATGWLSASQSRASSVAHLALAEAKLAAISVAMMAFFGALAAAFAVGAWGLGVAAVLQLLAKQDISLWLAMLVMGLAHVIAAMFFWRAAKNLCGNLEFNATRSQFSSAENKS